MLTKPFTLQDMKTGYLSLNWMLFIRQEFMNYMKASNNILNNGKNL